MKKFCVKILTLCFMTVLLCTSVYGAEKNKDGKQKFSVSLDFLNTSFALGLNGEYSPNQYFDFGAGITPLGFMLFPALEGHLFARVCFLDYFIQPYLQLGVSFVAPGQVDLNENWFNARAGAGVKISFSKDFYCGVGASYSFVGQNLTPLSWRGLSPSVFVGYTALRF